MAIVQELTKDQALKPIYTNSMIETTIVGAGMTAIAYAKLHPLKKILILEKSRGIGGRIATRRLGDAWIDHGAEKIKGEHSLFQSYNPEFSSGQWIKSLATDLEIKKECRVETIIKTAEGLEIWDDKKQLICTTKEVIITPPAPQAKDILEASGLTADFLKDVEYDPSVQFMVLLNKEIALDEKSFYFLKKQPRPFLYHFEVKPEFISEFLKLEKEEIKERFITEMKLENIVDSHAHKWRYSTVKKKILPSFQHTFKAQNILLAGDYFYGHDLNAAVESAQNL